MAARISSGLGMSVSFFAVEPAADSTEFWSRPPSSGTQAVG
jgi:hypothetical protein